jgi:integrase/recombinase XerC
MPKAAQIHRFEAGQRNCPICSAPHPAHETWPGARYRFCGKVECTEILKASTTGIYVAANKYKCDGPACENFIPSGLYSKTARILTCSPRCANRREWKGARDLICDCGCGLHFLGTKKKNNVSGLVFISQQHRAHYITNKYQSESCGAFMRLLAEYLNGFASGHYRDIRTPRLALCPFFQFLNTIGIRAVGEISSKTITDFLTWARQAGVKSPAYNISKISTFFKWLIAEGRYKRGNPVVGLIHNQARRRYEPRPLGEEELELAWQLLLARGDARLRFAAAVALEAGLRISEICHLRLSDVDMKRQTLFVRLPNKSNVERWAFFGDRTKRYYLELLAEREPNCPYDNLLLNNWGQPCKVSSLRYFFNNVLRKNRQGKIVNAVGFEKWSTHRLRHNMATTLFRGGADTHTVMAAGGWASAEAMSKYVLVDIDTARRGYDEALRRLAKEQNSAPSTTILSPAEFLARRGSKTG